MQGIDEITYSKWVRKNNFYQKIEFTESGTVAAETLDEITTKIYRLHVERHIQSLLHHEGSLSVVHDFNLTVDMNTGLDVVPVVIISNQTLHEKKYSLLLQQPAD